MRALASDFDGTIFFEDGFRDEDLKQIQAYKKQGNMFGICTGRPLADLQRDMTKSLDLDFYICSTGALILDKEFNEIYKSVIERELVEELVNKYI
ncbi:MAG: HAD hydrolase family protein, partial [Anaerorhabdus sp.]